MNNKLLILIFSSCLILLSCEKKQCRDIDNYTFEIPFTLTPALDTFQIGDTITFSSRFEKNVMEFNTDETYTLEDFKFFPTTEINQIDVNPSLDGVSSFELIIENTTNYRVASYTGRQLLEGEYDFDGQYYSLTFQLIPTKTGLFYLKQLAFLFAGQNQSFEGKCSDKDIKDISNLNNGVDNNIELLLDSPDPHYNTWILEKPFQRFHKFGGYCFYVVE